MKKTRTRHTAEFKTKVAIEAIKEQKTLADLSVMFGVTQQSSWYNNFSYQSYQSGIEMPYGYSCKEEYLLSIVPKWNLPSDIPHPPSAIRHLISDIR